MTAFLQRLAYEESGHMVRAATSLFGAVGAIGLALGVTGDNDTLVWLGAIALALGFINAGVVEHTRFDYPVLQRIDALEHADE